MTPEQRSAVEAAPGFSRWSPWGFDDSIHFFGDPVVFEDELGYILGPYWERKWTMIVDDEESIERRSLQHRAGFYPIVVPTDLVDDENE